MDIKIYVASHKKAVFAKNKYLYPIQVGCVSNNSHIEGILHDDTGENISDKNPFYCELTAQYWAWKNDLNADYYGLFHYRRYMSFSEEILPHNKFQDVCLSNLSKDNLEQIKLDENTIEQTVSKYDVIVSNAVDVHELDPVLKSVYHQYCISEYLKKDDIDLMLEIIKDRYPDYYETAQRYIHGKTGYFCNMFIMKKEIFKEYSTWLFGILFEYEKRRNISEYDVNEARVIGHLGERLLGIYYMYLKEHGYKCHELQRTLFKNTDETVDLVKPYFENNNIAVAFAANDYFMPYLACTLESLVDNSNKNHNYDIIVMSQDISQENKNKYKEAFERENVHIRFINPLNYMSVDNLYTRGHFSLETYYRLGLFKMLPDYEKIVYLDADLIIQADIADLYSEDIEGYLIGATSDADSAGLYKGGYERNKKKYVDNVLKLKDPYKYFQAGVLLFNLKEFRKQFKLEEVLSFASSRNWELLDQDILNVLCEDKVKYVDMSWNVMMDYAGVRIQQIISKAPYSIYQNYMQARKKPKIIHYAGPIKPWNDVESDMADIYWYYAKKTPYYEVLLYRMSIYTASESHVFTNIKKHARKAFEQKAKCVRMKYIKLKQYMKIFIERK